MRLAFFQPDIPQNLGGAVRLAACLRAPIEVIEPCAFPLSDPAMRRAALDYGGQAEIIRRRSWVEFIAAPERRAGRLVLFTTRGAKPYTEFAFHDGDTLLFGQESAGVPQSVHEAAQARLIVPIAPDARSLTVVAAAAMALGEALRQTRGFPGVGETR
jgi:tRNA (cytidine/uridine-2'-O-)-methyltransferase